MSLTSLFCSGSRLISEISSTRYAYRGGHADNRQTDAALSATLDSENEGRQHGAEQVPAGPGDAAIDK